LHLKSDLKNNSSLGFARLESQIDMVESHDRITNRLGCGAGVAHLVERRASNRKVMKPWVDFRCVCALLCPWESL